MAANDGILVEAQSFPRLPTKAGVPADSDWTDDPPIGVLVIDTTNSRLYMKTAEDTWKYASLT